MDENALDGIHPRSVAWTPRDVWLAVAFLFVWWFAIAVASVAIALLELEINPGVFIGLAELALLAPVWWLALHKYGVGWDSLGLRDFRSGMLGLGCGLMLLSFAFEHGIFGCPGHLWSTRAG